MKYKEILKKKGDKDSDGANTSRKSEQADIVEETNENSCDVLTAQSGNEKYPDTWLLDSGSHTRFAQKENGSVHTSLTMEALS